MCTYISNVIYVLLFENIDKRYFFFSSVFVIVIKLIVFVDDKISLSRINPKTKKKNRENIRCFLHFGVTTTQTSGANVDKRETPDVAKST